MVPLTPPCPPALCLLRRWLTPCSANAFCGPQAPRALQADLSQCCPQSVVSPQVNVALMLSSWPAVSARWYPEFSGGAGDHQVA